jgi:hypothetical protein
LQLARRSGFDRACAFVQTEVAVAVKVAETIFARGLAGAGKPADVPEFIEGQLYKPEYST